MNTITLINEKAAFREINKLEPEWLYRLRKRSWEAYNDADMPDKVSHLWRYTDPADFIVKDLDPLRETLPLVPDYQFVDLRQMQTIHSAFGYNTSGRETYAQITPELAEKGIIFKELFSATRDNPKLTEGLLGSLIDENFGKFEALNLALWNTGFLVYIPDNSVIEKPIYLHRHPTGMSTIARLLVVIGKNVEATIIDDYSCHCRHQGAIANSVVEIFAGDYSKMRYVNIQRFSDGSHTLITQRAQIGEGAKAFSVFGSLGSGISKINSGTILNGRRAESRMSGFMLGAGAQHFDLHTTHHHKSDETFSNLDFRVVLKDKAQSAYTGLIRIEKNARNCEAYQENRNLLLDKGTRAESIPELEILNDEVHCTHGATMGPIDPEMIYYLQSRGIPENKAEQMIIEGFMEPTFGRMPESIGTLTKELFSQKLSASRQPDGEAR